MVVGRLPVVKSLLPQFLGWYQLGCLRAKPFQRLGFLLLAQFQPARSIAASEVIGMSDRIYVMCEGRITGEVSGADATEHIIMQLATDTEGV